VLKRRDDCTHVYNSLELGRLHSSSVETDSSTRTSRRRLRGMTSPSAVTWLWELPKTPRFRLQTAAAETPLQTQAIRGSVAA
jgi:hypothetical protein